MSGTSSRARSSTSGRGSFSSTSPERESSSTVSPLRSLTSRSSSSSSTTRSSSARPTISTRVSSRRSLKVTTSPVRSALRASTTLSDSLSTTSAPRSSGSSFELRVHRHAHLAAAGEHVDGAVVVVAEQRAVGRRRLGELVDLLAERGDVVARLPQGVGELLVLRHRLAQLALGLEQPLLERAHALGRVLEPPPQREDLLLEGAGVLLQLGQLVLLADGDHLLDRCLLRDPTPPHSPGGCRVYSSLG